ncbi:MAG: HAMP domain-containing sensor histidine kinase, partial [Candidatus Paceibacterota bacterium]
MSVDINTCYETTKAYHLIALYSHTIPVFIAVFLGVFAFIKKRSLLTFIFLVFTLSFSLWLGGDLVDWLSPNYFWVYYTWSWLDFVNVVFFICGAYFYSVLSNNKISAFERYFFILVLLPAFVITVTGGAVVDFNQPVCEATNSDLLTNYKLIAEGLLVLNMLWAYVRGLRGPSKDKKLQISVVLGAILLFFAVFAGTEYYSSVTGIYEVSLYGLFALPIFLVVMMFAATNLGVFDFRLLGSQILAYALIIMSGSQLLFIQDSTQTTLSVVTLGISIVFGVLLLQNAQKEEQVRLRVEELAKQLDLSNKSQVTLIHFITHQVKGFVAKSRNIFSMIQEGDYGEMSESMKAIVAEGFASSTKGAQTIQEILNAANIKSGKVAYASAAFDFKELMNSIVAGLKPNADAKGVALTITEPDTEVMFTGDRMQMENAIKNLIDNSIKYTQQGTINVTLTKDAGIIRLILEDTGVGITAEDMTHLFTEGGHGAESQKVNVDSTGFGLYIVKNIIEGHKGKVWAESEGAGKGSKFIVELPAT